MNTVELSQKFQTVSLEDLASVQGGTHHSKAYNYGNTAAHVAKGVSSAANIAWNVVRYGAEFFG
ncbi:hypothetical protein [Lactobacillus kalixensis]|nr:hypothetical protein [Lactobacillus kalixensis]